MGAARRATGEGEGTGEILLHRYGNRRLYDVSHSRHVTLGEVLEMIRRGARVRVEEAGTRRDITGVVLTHLLLEEEKRRGQVLPSDFLHTVIGLGPQSLQEFFHWYLRVALDTYRTLGKEWDEGLRRSWEAGVRAADFPERFRDMVRGATPAAREGESAEVEALRRDLAALRAEVTRLTKALRRRTR